MGVSEQAGRANNPSIRTTVSHVDDLKELMDEKVGRIRDVMNERDEKYRNRFIAIEEKTALALSASEKATNKADASTEKRFESVNEFRGQLKDQTNTLIPRQEADAKIGSVDAKVEEVKKEMAEFRAYRAGQAAREFEHGQNILTRQFDLRTMLALAALLISLYAAYFKPH